MRYQQSKKTRRVAGGIELMIYLDSSLDLWYITRNEYFA